METNSRTEKEVSTSKPVSYTHLDVYKRQPLSKGNTDHAGKTPLRE